MSHYVRFRFAALLIGVAAAGASAPAGSVDDTVTALMAKHHIPGLSLAIIQEGKIAKARGYGVVEIGRLDPVTTDTLFQAGSVSKSGPIQGVSTRIVI